MHPATLLEAASIAHANTTRAMSGIVVIAIIDLGVLELGFIALDGSAHLVAASTTFLDFAGAMSLVMLLAINHLGAHERLLVMLDGRLGLIAVDLAARGLVLHAMSTRGRQLLVMVKLTLQLLDLAHAGRAALLHAGQGTLYLGCTSGLNGRSQLSDRCRAHTTHHGVGAAAAASGSRHTDLRSTSCLSRRSQLSNCCRIHAAHHRVWIDAATTASSSRHTEIHHAAAKRLVSNLPALLVQVGVHGLAPFSHRRLLRRVAFFGLHRSVHLVRLLGMVHGHVAVLFLLGLDFATLLELQNN